MPVYLSRPPQSPLARALAAVVGAVLLVGAFMVGIVAFLVMLGVGLVGGAWFWFRTRHLRRAMREGQAAGRESPAPKDAIEGEYTVVSRDDEV